LVHVAPESRTGSEHEHLDKYYNDRCAHLSLYVPRQSFTTHPVVGLTGGIATGKSTVSNLLRARGVPLIDADLIARQVVEPGTPALDKIKGHFGDGVIQPDGTLDRKKLGTIIFNDEEKRRKLNGIVHPAVRWAMLWQVLGYWIRGNKYCVLDVPLLIEGPLWKMVGKVVVVYWYVFICITHSRSECSFHSSVELQLLRLMLRDNSSREDASSRLNSQLPIAEKVKYADIVIDNSGTRQELEAHVDALVRRLEQDAGWTWRLSWVFPLFMVVSAVATLFWRAIRRRVKDSRRGKKD
jgi:dephospho-CoA kinase